MEWPNNLLDIKASKPYSTILKNDTVVLEKLLEENPNYSHSRILDKAF